MFQLIRTRKSQTDCESSTKCTMTGDRTFNSGRSRVLCSLIVSAAFLPLCCGMVYAQEPGKRKSGPIEEITVTATKRATTVGDTSLAITALTGEHLSEMGANDFIDYFRTVPGLAVIDQGPSQKRYVLRGLQSVGEAQVGLYYDEVAVTGVAGDQNDSGSGVPDLKLWDVERVEVLRGPQGTLYGAGSMGGTVRIVFNQPNLDETEFALKVGLSDTENGGLNTDLRAMANFPLVSDKAAVRFTAYSTDASGFIDNVRLGTKEVNDEETYGSRASLAVLVTDRWDLDFAAIFQNTDLGGTFEYNEAVGDLKSDRFVEQPLSDELTIFSATSTYSFDHAEWVTNVSLVERDQNSRDDTTGFYFANYGGFAGQPENCTPRMPENCADFFLDFMANGGPFGPFPFIPATTPSALVREGSSETVNFESRLTGDNGKVLWTAGLFYQNRDEQTAVSTETMDPATGLPLSTPLVTFLRNADQELQQLAVFGDLEYQFTDRVSGSVGLRWFEAERDEAGEQVINDVIPPFAIGPEESGSYKEDKVIGKLKLSYNWSDDTLLYGLWAEGYRPGGPNQPIFGFTPPSFNADTSESFEVGLKTMMLDGYVSLNLSAYRILWKDMQVLTQEETGAFDFVSNFGEAEIYGFEAEMSASIPNLRLTVDASLNYTDARLKGDQPLADISFDQGRDGDPIPHVPEWSGSINATHTTDLKAGKTFIINANWSYTGSSNTTFNSDSPFFLVKDSYQLVNLRAALEADRWTLAIFAKNLLDERSDQNIEVFQGDVPFKLTSRPRTIGAEVEFRF